MYNTILETKDYVLVSYKAPEQKDNTYRIINKQYEVIEIECLLLPQAYKYLEEVQAALDSFTTTKDIIDSAKISSISPKDKSRFT